MVDGAARKPRRRLPVAIAVLLAVLLCSVPLLLLAMPAASESVFLREMGKGGMAGVEAGTAEHRLVAAAVEASLPPGAEVRAVQRTVSPAFDAAERAARSEGLLPRMYRLSAQTGSLPGYPVAALVFADRGPGAGEESFARGLTVLERVGASLAGLAAGTRTALGDVLARTYPDGALLVVEDGEDGLTTVCLLPQEGTRQLAVMTQWASAPDGTLVLNRERRVWARTLPALVGELSK